MSNGFSAWTGADEGMRYRMWGHGLLEQVMMFSKHNCIAIFPQNH
jgi:hypothetical protein